MRTETAATIAEYFPGSKWASPDSARHADAATALEAFTHEDIVQACKSLRANLSRTHCTAEELAGEVKRNQRKAVIHQRAMAEGINPQEVEQERRQARNALLLAPREVIAKAVARCRKIGMLDGAPLSPKVEEWSAYTVGIVYAAIEQEAA